ncbi:MAG: hypothetical protein ACRC0A_01185 [Chitinophagaceae bacterium]
MLLTDIAFNIPLTLSIHSMVRWGILILGFMIVFVSTYGWLNKSPFSKIIEKISLIYSICIDIMLILGIILWIWGSWGLQLIESSNFKAIMQQKEQRFFFLEHPLLMFIALILVHISRIGLKSNKLSDNKKYRKLLVWNLIAYILILFAIPWFKI